MKHNLAHQPPTRPFSAEVTTTLGRSAHARIQPPPHETGNPRRGKSARLVRLGSTEVSALSLKDAVAAVLNMHTSGAHHLVVTPNVDHLVMLERDPEFASAYARASLRVADGAPLVLLARMLGTPVPQRVAGVDLALSVLAAAATQQRSVFFFGGKPAILDQALTRVREMHPGLRIVGSAAPPIDLDVCSPEERAALASIRETKPDLLLLFLGAPKQEKWFWRRAPELPPTVALAVGGTVDLIAGAKHRAPRLVQSAGCEWLWRMSQEPKRLGKRYLVHDSLFLRIATTQLRERYARQPAIRDDARP